MQYEVAFGTDMAHRPTYLEISSVSSSENFGKYFSLQVVYFGVSDFTECNMKLHLALISPTDRHI